MARLKFDDDMNTNIPAPPPSAASIAASVRKSGAHQAMALRVAKVEAERVEALATVRRLIAENRDDRNDPEIRRLDKSLKTIESTLADLRRELRPHRDEHARRVAEALEPMRKAEAMRLVHALADARAAVDAINSAEEQIFIAGADADYLALPSLGELELLARHRAGLDEGDAQ